MSTTDRRSARSRPLVRRTGLWAYKVGTWTFAVWAGSQLFEDFRVTGAPSAQLLAAATVGVVSATAEQLVRGLVRSVPRRLGERGQRAQRTFDTTGDARSLRWVKAGGVAYALLGVPVTLLLSIALALWPGVLLAQALALPVALPSGWAFVVASLVTAGIAGAASQPLHWSGPRGAHNLVAATTVPAAVVGILGLAEVLLPGVRLAPVPGPYPAVVVLVALAVQTFWFNTDLRTTRRWALVWLVLVWLQLWGVSWLSSYMVMTLHIAGFWTFALVSVLLVGAFAGLAELKHRLLGPPPPSPSEERAAYPS